MESPYIGKGYRMKTVSANLAKAIETITDAATVYEALLSVQEIYDVDFVTYHLTATVISDLDAPFVQSTYSPEWIARYFLNRYVQVDPVVQQGFLRQLPFDWREFEMTPEIGRSLMTPGNMASESPVIRSPLLTRSADARFSPSARQTPRKTGTELLQTIGRTGSNSDIRSI